MCEGWRNQDPSLSLVSQSWARRLSLVLTGMITRVPTVEVPMFLFALVMELLGHNKPSDGAAGDRLYQQD